MGICREDLGAAAPQPAKGFRHWKAAEDLPWRGQGTGRFAHTGEDRTAAGARMSRCTPTWCLGIPKKAHSACHPLSLWPEIPSHGMVRFGRSLPGTGSASQRLAFRLRAAFAAVASGQLGAVTAIGHLHRDG